MSIASAPLGIGITGIVMDILTCIPPPLRGKLVTMRALPCSLRVLLSIAPLGMLCPASAKVIFKADFETGDLSEWSQTGTRGQNATPRNAQVETEIVHSGKYAGKFTIHEDDVFNPQQLRVQVGGPRITVEEGSDLSLIHISEPTRQAE